ncbi:transketolase [Methylobacterium indicum]|uniref:transketolase family protein n=1 Tax=Methylobacterium indicum TaxID=1775910 RepID=UPI000734565C|nr:transketolase [Methylobacterium indicum]KTS23238.1 transketolase [Methylobacterium indicum]KTS30795.1 transketolase [Methylobacterium indicum]KTS50060.1 transketolase [Methylobacterium indicum]
MRRELCQALVARAARPELVFLTGDLGFGALEPLRDALGERFLNAGIAEQNMIGVAAALASEGLEPWTYTIAPFCYARAFEQIRNDVCLHRLPVRMLANGGGYGYGVMGPTHHALEDYGILSTLPGLRILVPAFDSDVGDVVAAAGASPGPVYVRLGRGELPAGCAAPAYAPWRRLRSGRGPVVVAVGPMAGIAWGAFAQDGEAGPEVWAVSELPLALSPPPQAFADALAGRTLCVVEEHVAQGGLGQALAAWCLTSAAALTGFRTVTAAGYPSGTYGSQAFHRRESGLDAEALRGLLA